MSDFSRRPIGRRPLLLAGLGAVSAVGLSSCSSDGTAADPGEADLAEITFAVPDQSLSAATAAYATVPNAMGYFADGGLSVQMQPVESALAAIQSVASGQSFGTYASTGNAVSTIVSDPSLVIVGTTTGNIFRTVARRSSGLTSVADLAGVTIGSNILGSISLQLTAAGMAEAGVAHDPADDLAVGYGAQAAQAFDSGDIDAYSGYDGPNLVIGNLLGEELVELQAATNDLTGTSALIVRRSSVADEPEKVAALFRAFFQGMVFSAANPEAAVRMHWETFPQTRPNGSEDEALDQAVAQLTKRLEIVGQVGSTGSYGQQQDADLQATIDLYLRYGVIPETAAGTTVADVTDYSLVEQFNDFDVTAVEQAAADWTAS